MWGGVKKPSPHFYTYLPNMQWFYDISNKLKATHAKQNRIKKKEDSSRRPD